MFLLLRSASTPSRCPPLLRFLHAPSLPDHGLVAHGLLTFCLSFMFVVNVIIPSSHLVNKKFPILCRRRPWPPCRRAAGHRPRHCLVSDFLGFSIPESLHLFSTNYTVAVSATFHSSMYTCGCEINARWSRSSVEWVDQSLTDIRKTNWMGKPACA